MKTGSLIGFCPLFFETAQHKCFKLFHTGFYFISGFAHGFWFSQTETLLQCQKPMWQKAYCVCWQDTATCYQTPSTWEFLFFHLKPHTAKEGFLTYSQLLRLEFIQQFLICSETHVEIKANECSGCEMLTCWLSKQTHTASFMLRSKVSSRIWWHWFGKISAHGKYLHEVEKLWATVALKD